MIDLVLLISNVVSVTSCVCCIYLEMNGISGGRVGGFGTKKGCRNPVYYAARLEKVSVLRRRRRSLTYRSA